MGIDIPDGTYYGNMHTKEITTDFHKAKAWHDDGYRVRVVKIRAGKSPFIWEYI